MEWRWHLFGFEKKKQAEFLIKEDVAPHLIAGFVCYNEVAEKELLNMGVNHTQIKVYSQAYY